MDLEMILIFSGFVLAGFMIGYPIGRSVGKRKERRRLDFCRADQPQIPVKPEEEVAKDILEAEVIE